MSHFFTDKSRISEGYAEIVGGDVNHIRNVLRMTVGDQLTVCSGEDDLLHSCMISEMDAEHVGLKILESRHSDAELPCEITLFQGLPKADKMELIVQKTVELGVSRIVPVSTKRTIVKLDAKKQASKIARWQQISESAAKQSGRTRIPEVAGVCSWKEALAKAKELDVLVIPYELAENMEETRKIFSAIRPGQSIGIFIGPEGGFEAAEAEEACAAGASAVTLGHRILRTETAGLATIAMIGYTIE
ncbi:MAG: 16S rRNA (uracil(1498)-N(3))-methyltransferase [Eubacteriales bacterium]|nr:16S rRNA (uracil(1498)-N(3))-methyltransferase [Eubacteriales bacterium]